MNTPGKNEDTVNGQTSERDDDALKQNDKARNPEWEQEDKLIGDDYEIELVQNAEEQADETTPIEGSENY